MWAQERAPKMLKKSNQKGFSIIEVLIVLAIAGLIMLIVFLAVPALQRSARNQGRQADASKFAAAVNQCLANNNGKIDNCKATGNVSWNLDDYSQLTVNPGTAGADSSVTVGATDKLVWSFRTTCSGATATTTTNAREFTVRYKTEGAGGSSQDACIGS
jgi:prepilin-type N-terminal cleavage/methylation domain-containing protein